MLFKTRSTRVRSPSTSVIRDSVTDPVDNGSPAPTEPATSADVRPGALALGDREAATASAPPDPGRPGSRRGSADSERDERRHQRATARARNGAATPARNGAATPARNQERHVKSGERLQQGKTQPAVRAKRTRLVLGKTVLLGMIGIIVVGLVAGGILGGLSVPGWVIGLLVATVTVILSTVLLRFPRIR
jgi:hypothetical protein